MSVAELFFWRLGDQKICKWYWWHHHWATGPDGFTYFGDATPVRHCTRCGRIEVQFPNGDWANVAIVQSMLWRHDADDNKAYWAQPDVQTLIKRWAEG